MIVHAIPDSINANEYGAGNWKAVEATRLALEAAPADASVVRFADKSPETVITQLTAETRHLLIEYSFWPELQAEARRRFPHLSVHVRTHNAEAYHYLHRNTRRKLHYLNWALWRRFGELVARDSRARRSADTLLGISTWDNANYWRYLPGRAAVEYLPYFSPWPWLRPNVRPPAWSARRNVIVSMGGNFDPSGLMNVANLNLLAAKLPAASPERWSFQLTWWSQWHDAVPQVPDNVEILRRCDEPWDLLCEVRALAVLTHLGFGFKTTIVDGLAAGCHVIVHPKLARRLPPEIAARCLICDPADDAQVGALATALAAPPPPSTINPELRERAVSVLRSTLRCA